MNISLRNLLLKKFVFSFISFVFIDTPFNLVIALNTKMEEEEEHQCWCCSWRFCRIVGSTIGWLGVLLSFILIYAMCKHPGLFGKSVHETIIPFLPCKLLPIFIGVFTL